MAYLIIPLLCFALLAGVSWLFIRSLFRKFWDGTVEELDCILSELMSKETGETHASLIMEPSAGTTVVITFTGSAIRLAIPLVPSLLRRQRSHYLTVLRDLELDPRIYGHHDGNDTLEWSVEEPLAKAATVIKDVLVKLLGEEATKTLRYQVVEESSGQSVFDQGAEFSKPAEQTNVSTAAPPEQKAKSVRDAQSGCFRILAGIFLWPIPFVIAYLQYGYIAASTVLIAIFILREIMRRWRTRTTEFSIFDVLKIVVLLLAGATINFSDPFYLQLIPTVALAIVAVTQSLASAFSLSWLSLVDREKFNANNEPQMLPILIFALVATCLGGAALNEYLRTTISLDSWIWYFAFVRIELLFGFLATTIPGLFYLMRLEFKNDDESD